MPRHSYSSYNKLKSFSYTSIWLQTQLSCYYLLTFKQNDNTKSIILFSFKAYLAFSYILISTHLSVNVKEACYYFVSTFIKEIMNKAGGIVRDAQDCLSSCLNCQYKNNAWKYLHWKGLLSISKRNNFHFPSSIRSKFFQEKNK